MATRVMFLDDSFISPNSAHWAPQTWACGHRKILALDPTFVIPPWGSLIPFSCGIDRLDYGVFPDSENYAGLTDKILLVQAAFYAQLIYQQLQIYRES